MKRTSHLILIAVLIISAFVSGFTYRDFGNGGAHSALSAVGSLPANLASAVTVAVKNDQAELPPIETYWNVCTYLESNYYGKKPDQTNLTYEAARGMVASLGDKYTRFLDPKEFKELQQDNEGDFEGIGAELDVKDGQTFVKKPIKNSPAIRAGIHAGDVILKVDDTLVHGMDIVEVANKIRGERGTKVTLTIIREGAAEPIEFEIIRDVIPLTIVEQRMEDDVNKIGYIALRQFNEKSDQQFDEALTELENQKMKGLILDLRGNPGGLLDVAIDIGSRFIPRGNIVIIQNKGGQRTSLPVERSKHNHEILPLVVLIDHGSASASEIVAGAIRDNKAGTLVGSDTFGKGLVQTIINIQGSAVSITTAKYFTPAGQDVAEDKIHPDVVIEPTDEDLKKDDDVQLKKAVQVLKERLGINQASFQ